MTAVIRIEYVGHPPEPPSAEYFMTALDDRAGRLQTTPGQIFDGNFLFREISKQ